MKNVSTFVQPFEISRSAYAPDRLGSGGGKWSDDHGGFGGGAVIVHVGGGGRILIEYGWIPGTKPPSRARESWLNPAELPESLEFGGSLTVAGGSGLNAGQEGSILLRYLQESGTLILLR